MTLTLYSVSGAPSPWRVQVGLALKCLPFELKTLSAQKQEHKTPDFLKLSPRGTVPVLQDGDMCLTDSLGILAWLDRAYPDTPLFGETPAQSALIWQRTMTIAEFLPPAISGVLRPLFFGGETQATEALQAAASGLRDELNIVEDHLAVDRYFSGDRPGAADAVAFPHIRLVLRAIETHGTVMGALGLDDMRGQFPGLADWVARIEAMPGIEATFPPHWQDAA